MSGGDGPLPPLVKLEDFDGKWDGYIDAVFAEFHRDFLETQPKYQGKWVRCRRDPTYRGKEAGFWHCTSEGLSENDRIPDLRRCERIRWIRFALEHIGEVGIDCWTNTRHRAVRHLVWVREEFLIVLEEHRRQRDGFVYYQLVTAYCTAEEHRKQKLRVERDRSRNG